MSGLFPTVAAGLALGGLVGTVHAVLLFKAAMALGQGRHGPGRIVAQAGRLVFVVLAFWLAAQAGAATLIAAAAGFTVAQMTAAWIVEKRRC